MGTGLGGFLAQVALTESRLLQAAVVAAVLRAAAVFLVATYVASSTLREINDKGLEHLLSLPLSRATQYFGRLAGYAACAAALAAAFALPLLLWAPPTAVVLWGVSLALEGALVAAAALFFAMTLAQAVPAIAATAGLYLLARTISAIQAIASGPLSEPSLAADAARWTLTGVSLLLPRLDGVARTEWLLYGLPSAQAYLAALAGVALYGAVLVAAGLFDFYRKSL
jgi:ABC-type Na+ efflux pump permease subunit